MALLIKHKFGLKRLIWSVCQPSFIPCDTPESIWSWLLDPSLRLECHEQWAMLLSSWRDKCWHKFFSQSVGVNSTKLLSSERANKVTPNRINHKKSKSSSPDLPPWNTPTLQGQKSQLETVGRYNKEKVGRKREKQQRAPISLLQSSHLQESELGAGDGCL